MISIPVLLLLAFLFALVGAAIGASKGRPEAGFFFGGLLGPLGWLIVAVGPNHKQAQPADAPLAQPAVAEAQPAGPVEAMLSLKKLLDAGAITPADYEAKKADLLQRI